MDSVGQQKLHEIAQKMKAELNAGTTPASERVTVRQLLGWFGHARRGIWIVASIRDHLTKEDLRTEPDIEDEYLDGSISIQLDMGAPGVKREPVDPTVRIGMLPPARNRPTSVRPNDAIPKATTTMSLNDFSQLPVMTNEREIKGVVTWRSIGESISRGEETSEVRHCMEEHREIAVNAPVFDALDDIWSHGYVVVRDTDRIISGIVTASDVSAHFAKQAKPFEIVREIELHLRNFASRFTLAEIKAVVDDPERPVNGISDLNFGAYCRLLENPGRWAKLNLVVDRNTFISHLERARQIRNELMHFAPAGVRDDDVHELERIAIFLRKLAPK